MADVDNLLLEHLRGLRGEVQAARQDIADLRSDLGHRIERLERMMSAQSSDYGHTQSQYDRLSERVARIERRLELREAE